MLSNAWVTGKSTYHDESGALRGKRGGIAEERTPTREGSFRIHYHTQKRAGKAGGAPGWVWSHTEKQQNILSKTLIK